MNKNNIFAEAIYGFKIAYRNILFRIFCLLAIVGIVICQFTSLAEGGIDSIDDLFHFSMSWVSQALPSSIAYKTAYFFNIIQFFLVIGFVTNDQRIFRLNAMESLWVRSQSNREIVFGNFLGKLSLFTLMNFLVFVIAILINAAFFPRSFSLSIYFFYWITLNFPVAVFFFGVSYLVTRLIRQQALSMVLLFVILGGIIYWGTGWFNGLFDPCARYVPNMFSDFTGHVNLGNYLLQRGFILLMGTVCLMLSVIPYPRIPNCPLAYRKNFVVACVIFLVAGSLAWIYVARHASVGDRREAYRQVYAEHGGSPVARVIRNDLHVRELGNGGISVTSRMNIKNKAAIPVPLVIYLNPGLKVSFFEVDGRAVDFERKYQALLPGRELRPGESVDVLIRYEGGIENDICFLDTRAGRYYSMAVNSFGIYDFGYAPAFCENGYKLLTPECIWYPVCVPPYGVSGVRDVNFSRYSLCVEHNPLLCAISQGNTVEEKEGETTFTFEHDMPGISLCVGNYKKREMMVDSIRMAFYCLPGHEYLLKEYDLLEETLEEHLSYARSNVFERECIRTKDFLYRFYRGKGVYDPTQQYPYRWMTLVEVPCDFYCFPSLTQLTGERVQCGMVFMPEKGYSLGKYPQWIPEHLKANPKSAVGVKLDNEIKTVFGESSCDIRPQLYGKTTLVFSRECPVIHDILAQVARGRFNEETASWNIIADYPAHEYLNHHSLKDALRDEAISPELLKSIMRKKSGELYAYIDLEVGKERFRQIYVDFLANHLFQEVALEEFFQHFSQVSDFPLDSLIRSWYLTDRLPLFEIQDARMSVIEESDEVVLEQCHFKVFNRSDVAGIIVADMNMGWVIPPREGREVSFRVQKKTMFKSFNLNMPLAQNFPTMMELKETEEGFADTLTGVFRVDSSLFSPGKDEIIVDNEDPGFWIVKAKKNFITSLFQKERGGKRYYNVFLEDAWLPTIGEKFYGFPVQSALFKLAGSGRQKVEWSVVLPREGKYEVFFYYVEFYSGNTHFDTLEKVHYYTVCDGEEEYDVTATLSKDEEGSWVSLGVFDFSKNAKVILSDRSINDEVGLSGIVADAVKWVKVKE